MAYGFNDDRSKVDVYTQNEADRSMLVEASTRSSEDALTNARIDTLVDHGTGGIEVREELWTSASGVINGSINLSDDPDNYDCLELIVGDSTIKKIARIPVTGGVVDISTGVGPNDVKVSSVQITRNNDNLSISPADELEYAGSWSYSASGTAIPKIYAVYGIKYAQDCSAEVADIRVGYDGYTHASAGDAVRKETEFAINAMRLNDGNLLNIVDGSDSYRGVNINIHNGIVHIYGTSTNIVRFRLNDGIVHSDSIYDIETDDNNLFDGGHYEIEMKLLDGTIIPNLEGDQTRITLVGKNALTDNTRREYFQAYHYDDFSNKTLLLDAAITGHIGDAFFSMNRNETIDIKFVITVKEASHLDRLCDEQLFEFRNSTDDIFKSPFVIGKASRATVDGLNTIHPENITTLEPLCLDEEIEISTDGDVGFYVTYIPVVSGVLDYAHYTTKPGAWVFSGSYKVPPYNYFRIFLKYSDTRSLAESDKHDLLSHLKVRKGCDLFARNAEFESLLGSAIRRQRDNSPNQGEHRTVVGWITDTHGDNIRWSHFVKAVDHYRPDLCVHTGDIVKVDNRDDATYFIDHLPETPLLLAIGNHEVGAGHSFAEGGLDNQQVFSKYISPLNDKYTLGATDNYYYYDVNDIRFICINCYDFDDNDGSTFTDRQHINYSQAQINWLINTLQDASTNGKSVVICVHEPDKQLTFDRGVGPFNESIAHSNSYSKQWSGSPICDIVEAFINGGSVNQSYDQGAAGILTVNTSFSSQNNFICWLVGHRHGDYCGYLEGYDQLVLTLCCGYVSMKNPNDDLGWHDLGKRDGLKSEDCFNFLAIDTEQNTVSIVRFGADTEWDFSKRRNAYTYSTRQ